MKKIMLALVAIVMSVWSVSAGLGDKYTINRDGLPEEAREFLDTHFPKAKVGMIKIDKHLLKKTDYDVKLVNGTKIEFSNKGKWTSVVCQTKEVPEGIGPKAIRTYVNKNFAGVKVVALTKKATSYEARLSDGVTLKFNLLGQFKSVVSAD